MTHISEVRCDLCDKVIERSNTDWGNWYGSTTHGKYNLTLTNKQDTKRLDLCYSCYKKCQKRIPWKKKPKPSRTKVSFIARGGGKPARRASFWAKNRTPEKVIAKRRKTKEVK